MAGTENNQLQELSESTYLSNDHSAFNVMEGQDDDSILLEEQRGGSGSDPPLREQDRFLPIANVARIMKHAVPKNGKIAKDAKECVQECVSEFISFITSEASERCHQEKRKTINGEDILFAMSTLGFDNYVEPLKVYLQKYRESCKSDKSVNAASEYFVSEMSDDISTLSRSILDDSATQNMVYYQDAGAVPQLNFG